MGLTSGDPFTKVIPMNTYTTFSITTKTTTYTIGNPHYEATVLGNGEEMETFRGLSMREVMQEAAEFIGAIANLYCEECAYVTDGQDESFLACGLCPSCYEQMMERH
jgi:hypothetical protein